MEKSPFDFAGLFELSPDLLCIAGFDGFFKKINSSVVKTLGFTEGELLDQPINNFIHPSDVEKTEQIRKKLLEDHSVVNFENRYITKSDSEIWLSWTAKACDENQIIFAIAKVP